MYPATHFGVPTSAQESADLCSDCKVRADAVLRSPLLPEDLYILTQDVENPFPDRRVKFDWRKISVIPRGVVFEVQEDVLGEVKGQRISKWTIRPVLLGLHLPGGRKEIEYGGAYGHLIGALRPYLEPWHNNRPDMKTRAEMCERWLKEKLGEIQKERLKRLGKPEKERLEGQNEAYTAALELIREHILDDNPNANDLEFISRYGE
jgi:hypothetical protein